MRRSFLFAPMFVVAAEPPRADACSPPPCLRGYVVPETSTTVPANLPALYWQPRHPFATNNGQTPDLAKLSFVASAGSAPAFTAQADATATTPAFVLVLGGPLVEGVSYAVVDMNELDCASYEAPRSTFVAGPAAPLPTSLGVLQPSATVVSSDFDVATVNGSCEQAIVAAHQTIQLQLSADALPWRDVLHVETLVDGERWRYNRTILDQRPPGSNANGRGRDVVYAACGEPMPGTDVGLAPGTHEVVMRATLPGSNLVLETPPITVELACDDGPPPDPDPDPPPVAETGCATSSPSWGVLAALFLLRRRRRQ